MDPQLGGRKRDLIPRLRRVRTPLRFAAPQDQIRASATFHKCGRSEVIALWDIRLDLYARYCPAGDSPRWPRRPLSHTPLSSNSSRRGRPANARFTCSALILFGRISDRLLSHISEDRPLLICPIQRQNLRLVFAGKTPAFRGYPWNLLPV